MWHQAVFLGDRAEKGLVGLGNVEAGDAQARQVGHQLQDASHQVAQHRMAGQVIAPRCDIDPGQHDFAIAGINQTLDFTHDFACSDTATGPPAIGNDAEGAAVITAVLDLYESAHPILEPGQHVRSGFGDCGDIVDADAFARRRGPGRGFELFTVADDTVEFGQDGPGLGIDLHGTAGRHDPGVGVFAAQTPDGLARLAFGLGGDGAGVDDNRVLRICFVEMAADDLGFIGIEAAAEGDDVTHRRPPVPAPGCRHRQGRWARPSGRGRHRAIPNRDCRRAGRQ